MGLLSLSIWIPIVFGTLLLAVGNDRNAGMVRLVALVGSVVSFLVTLPLEWHPPEHLPDLPAPATRSLRAIPSLEEVTTAATAAAGATPAEAQRVAHAFDVMGFLIPD